MAERVGFDKYQILNSLSIHAVEQAEYKFKHADDRMKFEKSLLDGIKNRTITDFLAIAVAISLPWSTSATSILMGLWIVAFLPTFEFGELRREALTRAGGLPLLLFGWAAVGMLWSHGSWGESLSGLRQFDKIIFIPLLIGYFRRSKRGPHTITAFMASCVVLLLLSIVIALRPEIQWWQTQDPGVPVKNYITQSAEFAMCAFWLFFVSINAWKARTYWLAFVALIIASMFVWDMFFVAGSRTELVAIAGLTILLGARFFGKKGPFLALILFGALIFLGWNTSSYFRDRVLQTEQEIQGFLVNGQITSTGAHLEFFRKSVEFIIAAPIVGHGTGSIKSLFERSSIGSSGISALVTSNPHNQLFAVAIQLGIVGAAILCAMWVAHLMLFANSGVAGWFGLVVVVQNILASLFNTHLFDFTEGWIYVCLVGLLGGLVGQEIEVRAANSKENYFWFSRGGQ